MDKPSVSPGEWIWVDGIEAVVCNVFSEGPNDLEVIFRSGGSSKTTNQNVKWANDHWVFSPESGGYADNYPRLAEFRAILNRGRQRH